MLLHEEFKQIQAMRETAPIIYIYPIFGHAVPIIGSSCDMSTSGKRVER